MDRAAFRALVQRVLNLESAQVSMYANVFTDVEIASHTPDELEEAVQKVSFTHKATTSDDDDEHWVGMNPFSGLWVHYAASPMGSLPSNPVGRTSDYPSCMQD